ncbi:hypothetical protein CUMW_239240 [Citrus unshiu]|uniref:PGG domain-containing protein n=1 Tax=Citrus unshiu TaxID=55188 RepID=A0A2H5QKM5_CITUN|nr:hypothetical protein CUMW_239240 [Citrus unshiu]
MMINSHDQEEDEYCGRCWPLYRMIEKNDWRGVDDFVTNDPDALTAKTIAPGSTTIFHAIVELWVDVESDDATCLLDKLASKVDPQTLEQRDELGFTALFVCAVKGNLRALKVLVKYNPDLTNKRGIFQSLPVIQAAYKGHKDTLQYLREVTYGVDIYSGNDGASMLSRLIDATLYDVALDLLKRRPTIGRDNTDSRRIVLNTLAEKPYAFASGSRLGHLQRLIYNCTPVEVELVPSIQTNGNQNVDGDMENLIVTSKIHSKTSTRFGSAKKITTTFGATWHKSYWMLWNALMRLEGNFGNNILHLVAKLVPSSEVAGAALQVQRELQWFKAVVKLIHPHRLGDENRSNQTPREVFTQEHKDLVKEGEKWMKETASSCSVVAALIITVVFAAAFTVPGGSDSKGIPNFLHEPSFMIFAISDMLALFSSITSVLMFLGILTSRYAEEDFLVSLPRKLIIGLVTLFFSIASMMVAFGAAVHISLSHKWNLVIIPIALVGFVPVTLFALLQFPLV